MSAVAVENLLALLYTNPCMRKDFEACPDAILAGQDLTPDERASLLAMDWPGLTLAGNSFGYKRWKANQWRHSEAYLFTTYENLFAGDDLSPVHALFHQRIASRNYSTGKLRSTHPGMISELFKVMPENQIDHEHVLLENPRLSKVCALWRRLNKLHLHNHYLIRAYFVRPAAQERGPLEGLHARPGTCITYVPLTGHGVPGLLSLQPCEMGGSSAGSRCWRGGASPTPRMWRSASTSRREPDCPDTIRSMSCASRHFARGFSPCSSNTRCRCSS